MAVEPTRLVLTGFMGAGKTVVGRALAARLGWELVDTDALVESLSGRTIPELFAEGEPFFRQWERQAIATLFARERVVIASGGGAVTDQESRHFLMAMGPIVCLEAPPEVLWQRAGADPNRPLSLDRAAFEARLAERAPIYEGFALHVDTSRATPEQAAERIARQLFADAGRLEVDLGERTYPIVVQPGSLSALPELLGKPSSCLVVTDAHVGARYAEPLLAALRYAGWSATLATVPAGESSKCLGEAEHLYDVCVRARLRRSDSIIALGGGVVGDLAGFVAATYQRGVPFVQVPTSLLAQIDSSVGGKVGINHPRGKNLIGAFYQPKLVLMDTTTLLSLPEREYRAGLGELVKYGVILDPELLALLERETAAVLARDLPLLNRLVLRCCQLKAEVVQSDERESGRRAILNFGHTVGHAIEAIAGYGEYLHGEAVAIGMVAEAQLAARRGLFPQAAVERLARLLTALGLPTHLPMLDADELLDAMGRDKKNQDARVAFVLPRALGDVELVALTPNEARAAIARA
ncbi:MAG TPA: 3-dehydroquinate synthase [Oscillatoriaceae cyanobacterium]